MAKKKDIRSTFRKETFKRDGYRCVGCGLKADPSNPEQLLNAHHITDRSEMPNGGYVVENGISLCKNDKDGLMSCHMKAEQFHISHGKRWYDGFHPDTLYKKIGSSKEAAIKASEKL